MSTNTIDAWRTLQAYTPARIGLGRAGVATTTAINLRFQFDHARARDAVHQALDIEALAARCTGDLAVNGSDQDNAFFPVIRLCSSADDRHRYLQRPDLGRLLPELQWQLLAERAAGFDPFDVVLIIGDGLSSAAVNAHALPVINLLVRGLRDRGFQIGPLCIASQARVALADDIGEALGAKLTVMLIGERPGLSSPDSLGMYITYLPKRGRSDAERNCVSNIREAGLSYQKAVDTALYLIAGAMRKGLSGTGLKDDSATVSAKGQTIQFLL